MDDVVLKNEMINAMLAQSGQSGQSGQGSQGGQGSQCSQGGQNENAGTLKTVQLPDKETLDKFKELVNLYIQTDDLKKRLQDALKEQNVKVRKLSQSILMFMAKYNVEDLKASDGVRLRYKKRVVKEPLSAKTIKERIENRFEELKDKSKEEIEKEIFERKEIEKVTLKRLKRNTLEI